ncbi:MAG TPA: DedA family protein [Myxococcota bacterium]|nr:DedA family protein [Myxococcota bacterium]
MPWEVDSPLSLALICLISGIVFPLPEDVALLLAGWAIRTGGLQPVEAGIAAFCGVLGRDSIAFGAGYLLEERLERWPLGRRLLRSRAVQRARESFQRRGAPMLFFTRFAIGMRAPLYFAAGMLGHRFQTFIVADMVGLLITTPLTLWLGWRFGEQAAQTLTGLLAHQRLVLALLLLAVGGRWWWVQRRRWAALQHTVDREKARSEGLDGS